MATGCVKSSDHRVGVEGRHGRATTWPGLLSLLITMAGWWLNLIRSLAVVVSRGHCGPKGVRVVQVARSPGILRACGPVHVGPHRSLQESHTLMIQIAPGKKELVDPSTDPLHRSQIG
jgi:hypothetical protein